MPRTTGLALACLSLFLVVLPLGLGKPGLPPSFKADEPAYYLMALSLARDGDLRCETRDIERLFHEYPARRIKNLILMTDDGWNTVYFGKPFVYSLLAAPFAGLWGANGMIAFNMALLVSMIWMGAIYLSRFNPWPLAATWSAAFFLVSSAFVYVFWLHPEILNMTCVMAALFFGLHRPDPERPRGRIASWLTRPATRACLAALALAPAVYNKPMLAAAGLPVLVDLWRRRAWKPLAVAAAAAVVAVGLLCAISWAQTGHPSAYLGVERSGTNVDEPAAMPVAPRPAATGDEPATRNSWTWLWRLPEVEPRKLLQHGGYFLWGRHTGLLVYMPFAALSLLLFLLHGRRDPVRWSVLVSVLALAVFFLVWIPFNWHGGGGFVGNRYFVNVYPAFLFLVASLRPLWTLAATCAWGGLVVGPLVLAPLGAAVPYPTLQAHVRGAPFRWFPLELGLRSQIPGYRGTLQGERWFFGRQDQFRPRGEEMWIRGASRSEVFVLSNDQLTTAVFLVRNAGAENRVELEMEGSNAVAAFAAGDDRPRRLELQPGSPYRVLAEGPRPLYVYRLHVLTSNGGFPDDPWDEGGGAWYLGTSLTFLGSREDLEQDLYHLEWIETAAPLRMTAGSETTVAVEVRNTSSVTWPADGAAAVSFSYHWLDAEGATRVWDGVRTPLPQPVPAGSLVAAAVVVRAPETPGRYQLALDLVREQVAWFSRRDPAAIRRIPIEVTAPEAPRTEASRDTPEP